MDKTFNGIEYDNLSDEEYTCLKRMKKRRKRDKYKIVITSDRCDYDDLSELANYQERGRKVGTFYFYNPNQLELLLKAFEGLFYQLFDMEYEYSRAGGGTMDDLVFEDWWDEECCGVCEYCFLRKKNGIGNYTCRKGL